MLSKLAAYTLVGIDATPVEVEVDVSFSSAPKTILVGLAETAVKESTHRVERAIVNSGYRRPIDRVVINLAPADLKKDAGGFDLPIALGLLLGIALVLDPFFGMASKATIVLIPIMHPCALASGPPELPGASRRSACTQVCRPRPRSGPTA